MATEPSVSETTKMRVFVAGYFAGLADDDAKKRYNEKLSMIGGLDPYETEKKDWQNDVDLWPAVTHINVGMYLLVTPSPISGEDLKNYKSIDCYMNFLDGWVREILVKSVKTTDGSEKRVVIAKVC